MKMAELLDNRTVSQCRSHHQKMIQKNKTIQGVTDYFIAKAKKLKIPIPKDILINESMSLDSEIENFGVSVFEEVEK